MFILFTNSQKRKFANIMIRQYEEVFSMCGKKMSVSQRLKLYNNLCVTLKVKRDKHLPPYEKY